MQDVPRVFLRTPAKAVKCGHWIGAERRYCRSADQVRHFLTGYRCPDHTPNALKGLPEPPPGSNTPKEDR